MLLSLLNVNILSNLLFLFPIKQGFGAFDRNILTQVEQVLMDKERLVKRTQTRRSEYRVLGKPEPITPEIDSSKSEGEVRHCSVQKCSSLLINSTALELFRLISLAISVGYISVDLKCKTIFKSNISHHARSLTELTLCCFRQLNWHWKLMCTLKIWTRRFLMTMTFTTR